MARFLQGLCVVVLGLALGLAATGCGSSNSAPKGGDKMGADKMKDDKMAGDKMKDDKMGGDKMKDDKMAGDKMQDDKMKDNKK